MPSNPISSSEALPKVIEALGLDIKEYSRSTKLVITLESGCPVHIERTFLPEVKQDLFKESQKRLGKIFEEFERLTKCKLNS